LKGVQLASRYAYPTTKLGYCGPQRLSETIYTCAKHGRCADVRELLLGYEALPIYLGLIARTHGLDPLDLRVVEAFWLGNELSSSIGTEKIRDAFEPLMRVEFYRKRLGPRFDSFPDNCRPTHSFHVLLLGSVTGVLDESISSINSCLVRKGALGKDGVEMECLQEKDGRMVIGKETVSDARMDFVDASDDDRISFHWNHAVQVLDYKRVREHTRDLEHHLRIRNSLTSRIS
jgi:hypothetical protein